jgi:DNA-binding phage protein
MNRKSKSQASRSHDAATVDSLGADPTYAAAYLDAVLADGDQQEIMLALRRLSDAFGCAETGENCQAKRNDLV